MESLQALVVVVPVATGLSVLLFFLPVIAKYMPAQMASIKSTMLDNRTSTDKLNRLIETAGVHDVLDAWKLYQIMGGITLFLSAMFIMKGYFLGILIAVTIGVIIPVGVLFFLRLKRQQKIEKQLVPFFNEMATRMRGEASASSAFAVSVENTEEPLRSILAKVVADERMLHSFEEALEASSATIESKYYHDFITAMKIYRQVNGDIHEILAAVTKQIKDNEVLMAKFNSQISAMNLNLGIVLLSPLLIAYMVFMQSSDIARILFHTFSGFIVLILVIAMYVGAVVWALYVVNDVKKKILS